MIKLIRWIACFALFLVGWLVTLPIAIISFLIAVTLALGHRMGEIRASTVLQFSHPITIRAVLSRYESLDYTERSAVRASLSKAVGDLVLREYIRALKHDSEDIVTLACELLGEVGDSRALSPLVTVIHSSHRDDFTRSAAVDALGAIGDVRVIPDLLEIMKDTRLSHESLSATARSLGKLVKANDDAVCELISMLNDSEYRDRIEYISGALAYIGGSQAVESLVTVAPRGGRDASAILTALHALGWSGSAGAERVGRAIAKGWRSGCVLG